MSPSRPSRTLEDQSPVSGLEIDILREAGDWAPDAEELAHRLDAMMPRIRITELLHDFEAMFGHSIKTDTETIGQRCIFH